MTAVTVHDATPDRWDDLVAVFEGPGDPGRCWCQWFYRGAHADREHAAANREALHEQVRHRPPGVLGYVDGVPSGWCAVRPRTSSAELYHGPLQVFLRAGFTEVTRSEGARPVVRLAVG